MMPPSRFVALLAALLAVFSPAAGLADGDLPIQDNSFLLEEAYNQEPGVIQHISAFNRSAETGAWTYSFTEEWPVRGQTHQASVTFNYADLRAGSETRGIGDVLLNYRWQAVGSGETPVAFAPRLTAVLPSGDAERGLGNGGLGVEVNLPLSVTLSDRFVSHVNLGGRYVPSADTELGSGELASFTVGQSFIFLAHRKLNFMVETVYSSTDIVARDGNARTESLTVNPGLRAAIDVGGLQIVPGVAVPIGIGPSRGDNGLFFYVSFEHPFRLAGPTIEASAAKPSDATRG
jgi:hypothetical protein